MRKVLLILAILLMPLAIANIEIQGESGEDDRVVNLEAAEAIPFSNSTFNQTLTSDLYLLLDASNDPVTGALKIDTSSTEALKVVNGNTGLIVNTAGSLVEVNNSALFIDRNQPFGTDVSNFLQWTAGGQLYLTSSTNIETDKAFVANGLTANAGTDVCISLGNCLSDVNNTVYNSTYELYSYNFTTETLADITNPFDQNLNTTEQVLFNNISTPNFINIGDATTNITMGKVKVGLWDYPYINPIFFGGFAHVVLLEGGVYISQFDSTTTQLFFADASNPIGRFFTFNWADNNDYLQLRAQNVNGAFLRIDGMNVSIYSDKSLVFGTSKSWFIKTNSPSRDLTFHNQTFGENLAFKQNGTLVVGNDGVIISERGDLTMAGNFTGNQFYAEGWGHNINEVQIGASGIYYNVTNLTVGELNGWSLDGENFTANIDGLHRINSHWSFSGTANNEYHISILVNGVQQDKCHAERVIGTGADVGTAGFTCLYRFSVGDVMKLAVENVDSAGNPDIHNINVNLERIGA